jgi:hypothetical protein
MKASPPRRFSVAMAYCGRAAAALTAGDPEGPR